jgi:hypothetical protein
MKYEWQPADKLQKEQMKNDVELDSMDQDPDQRTDHDRSSAVCEQGHTGAQRALLGQLELFKQREVRTRQELQRVRDDSTRAAKVHRALLDDAEKRSIIQLEIQLAEQDHLQRTIRNLEEAAGKAQQSAERREEEYSSLNTALLIKVSDLEATRVRLEATVLRLEKDLASCRRTMARKESYGRDKARRLDNALKVLAQERTTRKSLQESSSMKIGRLVTSALKHPWAAVALVWRLPKMIFAEARNNNGGTSK